MAYKAKKGRITVKFKLNEKLKGKTFSTNETADGNETPTIVYPMYVKVLAKQQHTFLKSRAITQWFSEESFQEAIGNGSLDNLMAEETETINLILEKANVFENPLFKLVGLNDAYELFIMPIINIYEQEATRELVTLLSASVIGSISNYIDFKDESFAALLSQLRDFAERINDKKLLSGILVIDSQYRHLKTVDEYSGKVAVKNAITEPNNLERFGLLGDLIKEKITLRFTRVLYNFSSVDFEDEPNHPMANRYKEYVELTLSELFKKPHLKV